jgi:N-acetylneuraminate synthase
MSFNIGSSAIGGKNPPYVIAEMSGNHNQDVNQAIQLIHSAKRAGANAIKLQTYTADTLTIDHKGADFLVSDKDSLWTGMYLHDLYQKAFTPWEWHKEILDEAKKSGIDCFSSVFDETSIDFLEDLNTPAYKIASFENNHLPLIAKAAQTGKPMIISLGLATLEEITEAVETARQNGCKDLALLKCTSNYPASAKAVNLKTMEDIKKRFNCTVGYSDHTLGIGSAVAAAALGASIIEKHLKLESDSGGVDSGFSTNEEEFKILTKNCFLAWESIGEVTYGSTDEEIPSEKFRRSIYAVESMQANELISDKNFRIIRPGFGIGPKYLKDLIGKKIPKSITKGERIDKKIYDQIMNYNKKPN